MYEYEDDSFFDEVPKDLFSLTEDLKKTTEWLNDDLEMVINRLKLLPEFFKEGSTPEDIVTSEIPGIIFMLDDIRISYCGEKS